MGIEERLKKLRKSAGLTQTELADRMGVHPQTISKWERGISQPDISQLAALASALGVSIEELFGGEKPAEEAFEGAFDAEKTGRVISGLRIARGESQEQLAEALGTSSDAVSRWERGITSPDAGRFALLAEHFGLSVSELYRGISAGFSGDPESAAARGGGKEGEAEAAPSAAEALSPDLSDLSDLSEGEGRPEETAGKPEESRAPEGDGAFSAPGKTVRKRHFVRSRRIVAGVFGAAVLAVAVFTGIGHLRGDTANPFSSSSDSASSDIPGGGSDSSGDSGSASLTFAVWAGDEMYTVGAGEWFSPQTPVREGYDFLGWEDESGARVQFPVRIDGDAAFFPLFDPIEYTVTFVADGKVVGTDTYTVEDKSVSPPEVPEKENYTGAWEPFTLSAGNVTVEAVYTPVRTKVTAKCEGGQGSVSGAGEYLPGERATLSARPYPGYDFLGWYDGSALLSEGAEYTFEVPMYAVTYTAKFAARAEMADFEFTSTENSCTLTGVKDVSAAEIVVPGCVTDIASGAFRDCLSVQRLVLPVADRNLGLYFGAQTSEDADVYVPRTLKEVALTEGVVLVADSAFENCVGIERIEFPDSLTVIGQRAFARSGLTEVEFPNGVEIVEEETFCGCLSLRRAVLPEGLRAIREGAFYGCSELEEISFPGSLQIIGDYAFAGCLLPDIFLSSSIREIGESAFFVALTFDGLSFFRAFNDIYYLGTREEWSAVTLTGDAGLLGGAVFFYSETPPSDDGDYWRYIDGKPVRWPRQVSVETDGRQSKGLEIEDGVVVGIGSCTDSVLYLNMPVAAGAFIGCDTFDTVVFGAGVTSIGYQAFGDSYTGCGRLKTAVFLSEVPPGMGGDTFGTTWDDPAFLVLVPEAGLEAYLETGDVSWQLMLALQDRIFAGTDL